AHDQKVAPLERLPVIGQAVTEIIGQTVSDVGVHVMDRLATDVGREDTDIWVQEIADMVIARLLQPSDELNTATKNILINVLEVVKDEVRIQRWKMKEVSP